MNAFSITRTAAMMAKEFVQMRRDRLTLGMMVGIPVIQLFLFGFAINSDPRHLPAMLVASERGPYDAALVSAMEASRYFRFTGAGGPDEAAAALARGDVQFTLHLPPDFSRALVRGDHPDILLVADATDPSATGNAVGAMEGIVAEAWKRDLAGPLAGLAPGPSAPARVVVHREFNPAGLSQFNIVPGLMGVILTMRMVMITSLAITRERERGTMENLLSMPLRPLEVMVGKIVPYILVGLVQVVLILLAAWGVFGVPVGGNLLVLVGCTLVFIAANLAVGVTFSSVATNQLQAVQMSFFFFLPSLLLSGFMFPYRGMPVWAQWLGEVFPLTHFNRIARGVLLKDWGWPEALGELAPVGLFLVVALAVALNRYRQTLD